MEDDSPLPCGWTREFSKSQNRPYYYNAATKASVWSIRETTVASAPHIAASPEENAALETSAKRVKLAENRVAIIVPFRDLDSKQQRTAHLLKFAPHMFNFLGKLEGVDFKIFVVEQSDDGRKFNRGKLLNLGFILAKNAGFNTFIFHDVDLLPCEPLEPWYARQPEPGHTTHIARCWGRYNTNVKYLGGIVSFCTEDFERIDGFPNIYLGWGGEDDELSKRVSTGNLKVVGPERTLKNAIIDLEQMSLHEKLDWLRANKDVKCEIKWEVNDEHDKYRQVPTKPKWWGLAGLEGKVTILKSDETTFRNCSIVTVDVGWNYEADGTAHWTNSTTKM